MKDGDIYWPGKNVRGRHHYISVDLETESWIYLFLFYATKTLTKPL